VDEDYRVDYHLNTVYVRVFVEKYVLLVEVTHRDKAIPWEF
jgi:hypothetical protein